MSCLTSVNTKHPSIKANVTHGNKEKNLEEDLNAAFSPESAGI